VAGHTNRELSNGLSSPDQSFCQVFASEKSQKGEGFGYFWFISRRSTSPSERSRPFTQVVVAGCVDAGHRFQMEKKRGGDSPH
jgi:hypothetical protein